MKIIKKYPKIITHHTFESNIDVDGTLKDFIVRLLEIVDANPDKELYPELAAECSDYDSYAYTHFNIIEHKLESDEDYAKRLETYRVAHNRQRALIRAQKRNSEADQRRLYEELKKKFDDKS